MLGSGTGGRRDLVVRHLVAHYVLVDQFIWRARVLQIVHLGTIGVSVERYEALW